VTTQVFQFIGPSNDGRRHGRGTYLLMLQKCFECVPDVLQMCSRDASSME
jgi:hypothetical protein